MKKNQAGIRALRVARLFRGPRAWKLAALAMAAAFPTLASAISIDAGDYTPLPAGANLFALYYQHAEV
ncbi:hypothetical protein [Burkholderia paludis]|uniref:hypothetical protein n=1 Tax=Burkholderia paludis TaxID=1506587 RepID=UPI001F3531D8|nr:hypothetical protein [Burkholderia paludis]